MLYAQDQRKINRYRAANKDKTTGASKIFMLVCPGNNKTSRRNTSSF
jgi:hypothetical protein